MNTEQNKRLKADKLIDEADKPAVKRVAQTMTDKMKIPQSLVRLISLPATYPVST